jgi:hypothetical protein
MAETMSKSSVRYVHQMAIYMVCNIFLFFLNSLSELTFWITLVVWWNCRKSDGRRNNELWSGKNVSVI